jgi:hypothetical protein
MGDVDEQPLTQWSARDRSVGRLARLAAQLSVRADIILRQTQALRAAAIVKWEAESTRIILGTTNGVCGVKK